LTVVFLTGEGSNDVGGLSAGAGYQTADEGFLQPVIRRITERDLTFKGAKLSSFGGKPVTGLRDALARKAFHAKALAEFERAEVLILATDVDSTTGERVEKRIRKLKDAIHEGFAKSDGPVSIAATPCRTIEAWALGDTDAVGEVARVEDVSLPKRAEDLWGTPTDPSSNHPKCVLHRIFGGDPGTESYAAIAATADLDQIAVACPLSFGPFIEDLRKAFVTVP
jgi:hypothetical protein